MHKKLISIAFLLLFSQALKARFSHKTVALAGAGLVSGVIYKLAQQRAAEKRKQLMHRQALDVYRAGLVDPLELMAQHAKIEKDALWYENVSSFSKKVGAVAALLAAGSGIFDVWTGKKAKEVRAVPREGSVERIRVANRTIRDARSMTPSATTPPLGDEEIKPYLFSGMRRRFDLKKIADLRIIVHESAQPFFIHAKQAVDIFIGKADLPSGLDAYLSQGSLHIIKK